MSLCSLQPEYLQFVDYLKIVCSRGWSGEVCLVTLHYIADNAVVIDLSGCRIFSLLHLCAQKASCLADRSSWVARTFPCNFISWLVPSQPAGPWKWTITDSGLYRFHQCWAGQAGWLCVLHVNGSVLVASPNPTKGGGQQHGYSCQLWSVSVLFHLLVLSSPAKLQ